MDGGMYAFMHGGAHVLAVPNTFGNIRSLVDISLDFYTFFFSLGLALTFSLPLSLFSSSRSLSL